MTATFPVAAVIFSTHHGEKFTHHQRNFLQEFATGSFPANRNSMFKKMLLGLLVILIIAQFIQPSKNNGVADASTGIAHAVQVPDSIMSVLKIACYDCHSDKTNYPWYSKITPINWWLKTHIDDGKQNLNFSIFTTYDPERKDHTLEEIAGTIAKTQMPLNSYVWVHKEAKLSEQQKKAVIEWTKMARQQLMRNSASQ